MAFAAAIALVACDGEGASLTDASTDAAAVEPPVESSLEFQLRLDDLWCSRYAECSGRASYETCKQALGIAKNFARFPTVQEQVSSGRLLFRGDRAASCLAAVASGSCAGVVGFEWANWIDPICLTVFEPAQQQGQPCHYEPAQRIYDECTHGLVCRPVTCDPDQCCEGTCEQPFDAPEEPPPPLGKEGEACSAHADCEAQLACDSGKCIVPRKLGDACWFYCAGENVCRGGACDSPAVVSGVTTCGSGISDTSICDAKHFCGNDGKCYPFSGMGDACGAGVGVCDWYFECSPDTNRCDVKRSIGASCSRDTQCLGIRSACTNGVCTQPHENGEACIADQECMSGHCRDAVCSDRMICE